MLETLLALLLLKSALAADANCPEGWDVKSDPNSGCYILVNRPMPHKLAQKYCSALDKRAKLVRVEDALENSFLKEYTYNGDIWLQAKAKFDIIDAKAALFSPGLVLRWKDGNPVTYANWDRESGLSGMDARHLCVLMNSRGKWVNADCARSANFVCERKIVEESEEDSTECPKKWLFYPKTGACYRAFPLPNVTWLEADTVCGEAGMHHKAEVSLASITSWAENKFVTELAWDALPTYAHILLGAIGEAKSRKHWDWVDGSRFTEYENWDRGMPRGNRRMAVLAMNRKSKWFNTLADKPLTADRDVVVCKFTPS